MKALMSDRLKEILESGWTLKNDKQQLEEKRKNNENLFVFKYDLPIIDITRGEDK